MNVQVNLSNARRNIKAILVTTREVNFSTTEAIAVNDAEEVVADLRAAIRAVKGRRP